MTTVAHRSGSFEHDAFIYDSDAGYVGTLVPLVEAALVAGDAVFAVVSTRNADLLRTHLGSGADRVEFIDARAWYVHPIATLTAYDEILRDLPVHRRAFVIGEVQFGDTDSERAVWTRYEAALNHALVEHNARVVCPYDARALPAAVIADARRTHPYLVTATDAARSADYLEPAALFELLPPVVSIPATPPNLDLVVTGNLRDVRLAFAEAATACGLRMERIDELNVAVNEVLTNALVHGGGSARFRLWSTPHRTLTCVVDDSGAGIADPLVGYTKPSEPSPGGYGAWLARRLFDCVEFISTPDGATVVLVAMA